MELQEYQKNALRTESIIEKLKFRKSYVTTLLELTLASTEILDGIKKAVYYNKPDKLEKIFYSKVRHIEDSLVDAEYFYEQRNDHDDDIDLDPRVFHGIIGIATEAGELLQVLVANLSNGTPVDAINVQEELGDISWYTAILNDALRLNWSEGLERNIAKLNKGRFKNGFTAEEANNRNLEAERAILEGKLE